MDEKDGSDAILQVTAYTDGGCDPNPGPGGWGAVIHFADREVELSGNDPQTTNNQMEMEAAIAVLAYLEGRYGPCQVTLHTDSQYLRRGIKEWIAGWVDRNWQTKARRPVKNQAFWRRLWELSQVHQVTWEWVKGHAGDPDNERVDELATQARARLKPAKSVSEVSGAAAPEEHSVSAPEERGISAPEERSVSAPEERGASAPEERQAQPASDAAATLSLGVSCRGNQGPGGWAAVLRTPAGAQTLHGHAAQTTSNALYLQAAAAGLRALDEPAAVTVHAASDYLVQGAGLWAAAWQQRDWRTQSGSEVKNRAEWEALLEAAAPHQVTWQLAQGADQTPDLAAARQAALQEASHAAGA